MSFCVKLLNFNFLHENQKKKLSIHSKDQNTNCIEIWLSSRDIWKLKNWKFLKESGIFRFSDSIYAIKCHQLELWSRCVYFLMEKMFSCQIAANIVCICDEHDVWGIENSIFMQILVHYANVKTFWLKFSFFKIEIKEGRALLFPRVEYNGQWTPVGRGDPLKDPTYDYMPPVLDRVRYWGEGSSSKNKNDILLLGVPSKKLSTKKDKFSYGPIKRNYYSAPYQSHFSSQLHHQPQQQQQQPQYVSRWRKEKYFHTYLVHFTAPAALNSSVTTYTCHRFTPDDVNTSASLWLEQ